MRTHTHLASVASVTRDGDFAYVQVACGRVTCKREGNRIVLIAGPDCQLAASGGLDMVRVAVSSKEVEKPEPPVVVAIA